VRSRVLTPLPQVQSGLSKIDADLSLMTNASILGKLANTDDVVFLESPED